MRAEHGYNYLGKSGYGVLGQLWYCPPTWPKLVIGSYIGRLLGEEYNENEEDE